jgi:site-specific DNA-methyltransferase (adenine-specific)
MIKNITYSDNDGIIINDDCYTALKDIDPGSVHLTVTSPPYDSMRTYNEYPKMDIINYGKLLYQATCDGGVLCVVIQDQTKKVKTGTSMMLAADLIRECGWSLFETTIYQRNGIPGKYWNRRFRVDHEYIHIFVKGDTPRYFNKEHMKIPTLHPGKKMSVQKRKKTDLSTKKLTLYATIQSAVVLYGTTTAILLITKTMKSRIIILLRFQTNWHKI